MPQTNPLGCCGSCCYWQSGKVESGVLSSYTGSRLPPREYSYHGGRCRKVRRGTPLPRLPQEGCALWSPHPLAPLLALLLFPRVGFLLQRDWAKKGLDETKKVCDRWFATRSASQALWKGLTSIWEQRTRSHPSAPTAEILRDAGASASLAQAVDEVAFANSSSQSQLRVQIAQTGYDRGWTDALRWMAQNTGQQLRVLRGYASLDPEIFEDLGIEDPASLGGERGASHDPED